MPLYEYECRACGYKFEELTGKSVVDTTPCKLCGKDSDRLVSRFASVIKGGSATESTDLAIGRVANERWQKISDRQSQRRGGKTLESVSIPKAADGRYMPVMALGNRIEREKKVEYVGALQEHRKKRAEKGQAQFDGPGTF